MTDGADRAAAVRGADMAFVVGAPRSGTTWLQVLLEQHPRVATCPETHLFDGYVAPLYDRWRWETDTGLSGLSHLLDGDDFDRLVRGFVRDVHQLLADKPDTDLFVEKTPQHALHAQLAAKLFPAARFLHIVRSPRDMVASLLAAAEGWGSEWAPAGPADAAQTWRRHVTAARQIAGSSRYHEIRFGELKQDPAAAASDVYRWLGLEADDELCARAAERCSLERLREEPDAFNSLRSDMDAYAEDFFRKGKTGSGKRELSRSELRTVEYVAGQPMLDLGYGGEDGGRPSGWMPLRVFAWKALGRLRVTLSGLIRHVEERL